MAKTRYDRNVDKGAAQQRNYGQGAKKEDNKPGTPPEETAKSQRHSGGAKNPAGPARGDQEPPWRQKPRGEND
jgi:hypothetical protein